MRDRSTNFTGGEVSGVLSARYDLAKYKSSCRHSENFIHELHGAVRHRGGTYFLEDLGGPGVLIPFEFSSDPTQNYVLIIQDGKTRIAQDNGFVRDASETPCELATPKHKHAHGPYCDLKHIVSEVNHFHHHSKTASTIRTKATPSAAPVMKLKNASISHPLYASKPSILHSLPRCNRSLNPQRPAVSNRSSSLYTLSGH